MNQQLLDKSIKNLDRSKIFLYQNQNNTSFVNNGEVPKPKMNKINNISEDFNFGINRNGYEKTGYINYLTENKEEFNSILQLK